MNPVGIEYPKIHYVSDVLLKVREGFPKWFREDLDEIAEASKPSPLKGKLHPTVVREDT